MSYALLALLVLVLSYLGSLPKKWIKISCRVLLVAVLSYGPAFLVEGADMDVYKSIYYNIYTYDFTDILSLLDVSSGDIEVGFAILLKICDFFRLDDSVMFFVCAAIVNALIVMVFYRFRYPVVIFLMFILCEFYQQESNIIRQLIACAICIYGLKYLHEKSLWKYIINIFIAFCFHKTALLYILFLPFCFAKDTWWEKTNVVLEVLWGVSLVFGLKLITLDLPGLMYLFEDTRYTDYFDRVENTTIGFDWFCNLIIIIYFVFCNKEERENIYAVFLVLSCVITNITTGIVTLRRLMLYFIPIYYAYAPTILTKNKLITNENNGNKYILLVIFFLYYFRTIVFRL